MNVKQRKIQQTRNTPSDDISRTGGSAEPSSHESNVLVSYGTHHTPFPIRGISVGQARASLSRLMNIDETAVAVINGAPVEEDRMIDDQVTLLSFVKPASIRGCFDE